MKYRTLFEGIAGKSVAPFTGAWIEITSRPSIAVVSLVAPFTGAWIEIFVFSDYQQDTRSLPSRERGLKYSVEHFINFAGIVAPFTGAWIEIKIDSNNVSESSVAPFTGAWIEIGSF